MRLPRRKYFAGVGTLTAALFGCEAAIQFKEPFQVVRPTQNHSSLLPVTDGLRRLAEHDQPISVVSVVGPYHSGKSFLLNSLIGDTGVFQIGRRTDPETMGIWLCRTQLRAQDGSEVWLMDSEGFFGPSVGETYDAKIFTIATLLGAHLVYNTVKVIDQQAVNLLEMLARRAQLFRTRSSAEVTDSDIPEFLSVRSFPPLTWVVEDFVQEIPQEYRITGGGATAWLKSYLSAVNDTSEGNADSHQHFLSKLYRDIQVHTLFLPATTRDQLQDLSRADWSQLTSEFKEEVKALRDNILLTLKARRFEGTAMTGRSLERAIRFIVQALQKGMFHDLPSLWATWSKQVAIMSLDDADSWFASLLHHIDTGEDPITLAEFNTNVEQAREKTVRFYEDLLHDFEVNKQYTDLKSRMAEHFDLKVSFYHERVRRWIGDAIRVKKEEFAQFLDALELPMDPDILKRDGQNTGSIGARSFNKLVQDFGATGPPAKLGRLAQMPSFAQEPSAQLTNDFRTLQGTRELENEREILQFFKAATKAADEAVELVLKENTNKLLGRGRMQELLKSIEIRCFTIFDEAFGGRKWMMALHHYRTHKSLVHTETYQARTNRFVASNDQRLTTHFRTALDRTQGQYRLRLAAIQMPVSEGELDTEHMQLRNSVREMLEEQSKELTDTDAYKRVSGSLNSVLDEGYEDVRKKNIELWTAHSDQARKCALNLNRAAEMQCGLMCLFNKVPQIHKKNSQKHLMGCFSTATVGSRMSPKMQLQVFENWYSKDLAKDTARVWNHFYVLSTIVCVAVMIICNVLFSSWICPRLGSRPTYNQNNYSPYMGTGIGPGMCNTMPPGMGNTLPTGTMPAGMGTGMGTGIGSNTTGAYPFYR